MREPPISDAPTFKTAVSDGEHVFPVETIEYEGKLWLVPEWLVNDHEGWRTPRRIICLAGLAVQDVRGMNQPTDFVLTNSIPKTVFDALRQGQPVAEFEVIERPPIRYRIPRAKMI
jgi:hypothetical protein